MKKLDARRLRFVHLNASGPPNNAVGYRTTYCGLNETTLPGVRFDGWPWGAPTCPTCIADHRLRPYVGAIPTWRAPRIREISPARRARLRRSWARAAEPWWRRVRVTFRRLLLGRYCTNTGPGVDYGHVPTERCGWQPDVTCKGLPRRGRVHWDPEIFDISIRNRQAACGVRGEATSAVELVSCRRCLRRLMDAIGRGWTGAS